MLSHEAGTPVSTSGSAMTVGTNVPGAIEDGGMQSGANSTVNINPGPIPSGMTMAFSRPSGALTWMTSPELTPGGNVTIIGQKKEWGEIR